MVAPVNSRTVSIDGLSAVEDLRDAAVKLDLLGARNPACTERC